MALAHHIIAQVYVKDTKSSNGTFINGNRLSDENQESDAYPLSNGDVIDFGVDILGENGVDSNTDDY